MNRNVITCLVASSLLLIGCQGSRVTPHQQSPFNAAQSWIRHTATQGPLIYAIGGFEDVNIYDFSGNLVGQLGGFFDPGGLCSDASGDVYVTDWEEGLIYAYPAGASLPDDVIDDRPEEPSSCAVDPTTGSLAVTNNFHSTSGHVVIYAPGTDSNPTTYTAPNMTTYGFAAYDPSGNLYVDGGGTKDAFELAVLYKGSSSFVAVPLSGLNNKNHRAAGIAWDGTYIAAGDAMTGEVYRLAISGSSGSIVQTVHLRGWGDREPIEFAIVGKKLLLPHSDKLVFYRYPTGGKYVSGFRGTVGFDMTVVNGSKKR